MKRLLIATTSRDKLDEIRRVLADVPVDLVSLADVPAVPEPEETGVTFEENARLKALYYASHSQVMTVADDSGLEIDAMDGRPGVWSARFLGPAASYPERFAAISRALAAMPDAPRTARFVCALAVVDGARVVFETRGTIEGEVIDTPRGDRGFGYDPIFYYPPYRATLGEVSQELKLEVAHRGKAFRQLAGWLRSID